MLRFGWRLPVGAASLAVVAWTSGCGDEQGADGSKHARGGSAGAGGANVAGAAGRSGLGGASGVGGAGSGGVAAGGQGTSATGGGGTGATGTGGNAGADAGAGGEGGSMDGGEGGQAGGEGGATAGEGGEAGSGAMAGAGGMSGTGAGGSAGAMAGGGLGGASGGGMGGAGMGGAGMGGAGMGGAGMSGAGGGGGSGGATIPGLDVPCQNGPGWTLIRWRYSNNGPAPVVDVWDATCSYSASSSSTCTIETLGGQLVESSTALWIDGSDELRARFSVAGLAFTGADVHVRARSYSTNASTRIRIASVLHGETIVGPVSQEFDHRWYHADWTGNLLPNDMPGATAVRLFAYQGSTSLAISSVEVCLR